MRTNGRCPPVFMFPIPRIKHAVREAIVLFSALGPANEKVMQIQLVAPLAKVAERNHLQGGYSVRSKCPIKQSTERVLQCVF